MEELDNPYEDRGGNATQGKHTKDFHLQITVFVLLFKYFCCTYNVHLR